MKPAKSRFMLVLLQFIFVAQMSFAGNNCEGLLKSLDIDLPARSKLLRYWGEYNSRNPLQHVRKFTAEEAEHFRFYILNGLIVSGAGSPYHSDRIENLVIDKRGRIYIFRRGYDKGNIRHSSLPVRVAFAGTIGVRNGLVVHLRNNSGHYCFSEETMMKVVDAFANAGVDIELADVEVHPLSFEDLVMRWWVRCR